MAPPRKRRYRHFEGEAEILLESVLDKIKKKTISPIKASEKYNIPKRTLSNQLNNRHISRVGKPCIFSQEILQSIV